MYQNNAKKTMDNLPTISIPRQKLTVTDAISLREATTLLSQLNTNLDQITAHKEAKTAPLNQALKAIRADYRPLEDQLEQAIKELRQSITLYATNQAKIALEQEKRILEDKRLSPTTKIAQLAKIDEATPQKVTTAKGSVSFLTVKKYRITDPQAVPREYLTVDEAKIKEAMKQATPAHIPGIEFYEEQSLRNYR